MPKDFWKYKEKMLFAELAGVSPGYLSDILHRHKNISAKVALKFEKISTLMHKKIPFHDWVLSKQSKHPAFYGRRKKI